jgi:hypothetical protein
VRPTINAANGWRGAAIAGGAVALLFLWSETGAWIAAWAPMLLAQILGFIAGGIERKAER